MPNQVSGLPLSQNAKPEVVRQTANFLPSIWGDRFLNYNSEDKVNVEKNNLVKILII